MYDSLLRIIFAGTPDFAMYHLDALIHTKHKIVGVFTKPDCPASRGKKLMASPVKKLAKQYNLPVFQPTSLYKLEAQEWISSLKADIMVVVAYGLLLPEAILNLPRFGCINVHGSLLPRWRGAAPIQRALWAGDIKTGITIIQMDNGLDTGSILHKSTYIIKPTDTSASLYYKLAQIGQNGLITTLEQIISGQAIAKPQDNAFVTYANKLSKSEARIDWHQSAIQLEHCIRAFNPWPISYFTLSGHTIKVWTANVSIMQKITPQITLPYIPPPGMVISVTKHGIHVATGSGILTLTKLQLANKKVMTVSELLNSRHKWFMPGIILN